MANPTISPPLGYMVDGLWLHPFRANGIVTEHSAWVGSNSPALSAELSGDLLIAPSRRAKISQNGVMHLDEGTVSGILLDRNGHTATEWMRRLNYLAVHQAEFQGVILLTNHYLFPVEIRGLEKAKTPAGWEVSFGIRELSTEDSGLGGPRLPHRWYGWD